MANPSDTSSMLPGDGPRGGADPEIPDAPLWLRTSGTGPTTKAGERAGRRHPQRRSPTVVTVEEDVIEDLPWHLQLARWLRTATATALGISLLFHVALLTGMWLKRYHPELFERSDITTVVEGETELPEEFDKLDDIKLEVEAGNEEVVKPQLTEMIEQDAELDLLAHEFLTDVTAAETEGEGGSTTGTGGGFRMLEPKNAVRKGSFTAWTVPIPQRFGEKPQSGDSPRPGQAYYIAIQVQLPEGRRIYKVSDLTGRVVGTDGYVQIIPAQAFVQDKEGQIIRASMGRLLPIVDGVAQILIRVPGAEALVKDTITVKSRLLKEEQTLELVFGERLDE